MSRLTNAIKAVEAGPADLPGLCSADLRALARILNRSQSPESTRLTHTRSEAQDLIGGVKDVRALRLLARAREVFAQRQRRLRLFERSMFGEPGWDILLALFIHDRNERMSITQIGLLVDTPTTTVLRWLKYLEGEQLITVKKDWLDGRVSLVELAHEGRERMSSYLEGLERISPSADRPPQL